MPALYAKGEDSEVHYDLGNFDAYEDAKTRLENGSLFLTVKIWADIPKNFS